MAVALDKEDPFHRLWTLVDAVKPWGIGPLTVYDVSVRVGARMRIEPQRLYLHTGARAGLIAMTDAMEWPRANTAPYRRDDWVMPHSLPARFDKVMTMDETEDFLCTYRTMYADLVNFEL